MSDVPCEIIQYGFRFGAAEITRICSDDTGKVVLELSTPKQRIQIHVTKTGKVRFFDCQRELKRTEYK